MRQGIAVVLLTVLAGCNSTPTQNSFAELIDGLHAKNSPLRSSSGASRRISSSQTTVGFAGAQHLGSGSFVSQTMPAIAKSNTASGGEAYELNLVDAPVAEAAKVVLGDALGVSYVVDPRVQGTVTLQTSTPVSREALTDILEAALAVNGASIVRQVGSYRIVPTGESLASTPAVSASRQIPSGPGVKVQVFELQHIAAEEMRTILEPISRQGSILRADAQRNYIVVAGNTNDLRSIQEAISVFDVDWMQGMSVAIHPLKTSQPAAVAQELGKKKLYFRQSAGRTAA